ncbi:Rpn family recombination-promoting nuclease/putative transposase [Thermoanaerobacter mathranii]|uniref:Rpn family recombination-promoting nuclease/putative transposase n=1 Tax=Thermoanaerobacter mathranii TaxID=583357 RepID=UPI003D6C2247
MTKKKNNYDSPDKILLKKFKDEVVRDIFGFKDAKEIKVIDSSLQVSKELRADTVFLIEDTDSKEVILHVEVQTSDDEDMPKRMHDYRYFLKQNYPGREIVQAVLYLGPNKPKMKNVYEEKRIVHIPLLNIKFESSTATKFGIIDIGDKTIQEILQSRSQFLLHFLCLTERNKRSKNPNAFIEECINEAKQAFKTPEEEKMLKSVYEGIVVHSPLIGADKNFVREIIKKEGVEKMINLKELPLYEDAYKQGKIEGKIEEKKEIIQRLFKLGADIDFISKATELPKEEIEKIRSEILIDEQLKKMKNKNIKL